MSATRFTANTNRDINTKQSLKWARKHKFVPPVPCNETLRKGTRLTPEDRFDALFNILLVKLERTSKRDIRYGNIWLYNHTIFAEDTAEFFTKKMSVAAIFSYFRTNDSLFECIIAWAKKNDQSPDKRTQILAARIINQYFSVNS